jgi:hypothetical protein
MAERIQISKANGIIVRLSDQGCGLVRLQGSTQCFLFTFDKIPGYGGETVRELEQRGFRAGLEIRFTAHHKTVDRLTIGAEAEESHASSAVASK